MARHRAFQRYKTDCITLMLNARKALAGAYKFTITFHTPTAHAYDRDNLISRFKAGQDALSAITGVDDSKFIITYAFGQPVKGGAVLVTV